MKFCCQPLLLKLVLALPCGALLPAAAPLQSPPAPVIEVWQGNRQRAGHLGDAQDESDANRALAPAYAVKFAAPVARPRTQLGTPAVPLVAGQLGKFADSPRDESKQQVDRTLRDLPSKVPHTAFVSAEGLNRKGDKLRFDADSYRELGRRYAAAFLQLARASTRTSAAPAHPPARPNILWLIAEDLSPDLGCYGATQVWTPHLDRLAAEGMRFTRAYTTAPVCSASRSAFMTGMYQTTIGAHNHRSHRDDGYVLPAGVRVLTDWLREAGYFTANVRSFPAPVDFKGTGKTDWNFAYQGRPFDSDRWADLKAKQPFYAQVNFSETHREYPALLEKRRAFSAPPRADPAKVVLPPYYPDHPEARADWANYLDSATELDRKIGEVLALLERDGLAENTIVIFMGDHGGAHVRSKQWCYESGLRVPLLIRWPQGRPTAAGFAAGTVSDRIVESIDVTATTLALAGAPPPPAMQGRAFLGDRAGPPRTYAFGARDRCDETVDRIRTVRDERYRYIRNFLPEQPFLQINKYKETMYPMIALMRRLHAEGRLDPVQQVLLAPHRPAEELYDLSADPYEIRNLAASPDPEHQAVRRRLRAALEQWIEDSRDQGRSAELPAVIDYWRKQMQATYNDAPKAK